MRSLHRNPFRCQRDLQKLHRNSICCHWARRIAPKPVSLPTRLGPRMFFRTSGRTVWPSSSPCRLAALRHLAPAPSRPSRSCTARCGRPAFASTLRTRRPLIPPAAEEPLAPRVAGAAGLAGHGRRGRPRAPAPSRRPCTRSRLLPKPSISQRHEFDRGLLQNEPPMEVRPVVAMPLP